MDELVKVNEFGIEETKAVIIANIFDVVVKEGIDLVAEYNELLKIDPEVATKQEIKSLYVFRQKAKRLNANTRKITKAEKAEGIAKNRYIDSMSNKHETNTQIMIDAIEKIEKFAEKKEKKRIEELTISRTKELEKFELLIVPENLGTIEEGFWTTLLAGYQAEFDNKILLAQQEKEKHDEEIRVSDMQRTRERDLLIFELETIPTDLGSMSDSTWGMVFRGHKADFDTKMRERDLEAARIAEIKRVADELEAEKERLSQLETDRRYKTSELITFIPDYHTIVFASLSEEDYKKLTNSAIKKRTIEEKKQEEIKLENERLKREAEEREIEAEKERKKQADIELKREAERNEKARVVKIEADKIEKARQKEEFEAERERQRIAKVEADKQAKLKEDARVAKERVDKLEADAEEKRQADIKTENNRKAQIEADKQTELNKGDKEKVIDLLARLEELKIEFSFDSTKNKKMYIDVGNLIDKIIIHVEK